MLSILQISYFCPEWNQAYLFLPPSLLSLDHSSSGSPTPHSPNSIWLYTVYHLILYPPFNPSSIPLHLPAACRTLTAQCGYQPLSGRRITAHGRLAGWPCPALHGIHAAAQLIQLACLAEETSAILITKWCILIPLTQSDCGYFRVSGCSLCEYFVFGSYSEIPISERRCLQKVNALIKTNALDLSDEAD